MYLPAHFEVTDKAVLHDALKRYPLGTWVVSNAQDIVINHIPFLFDVNQGAHGVLLAHVARSNPVWKQLNADTSTAVVFHAEQSYISPSWYSSKQHDSRVVPTWNYAVVHVHGKARAIEDKQWLLQHVSANTRHQEAHRDHPWKVSDAPEEYVDKLLAGIVGIEIEIESMQGKFKLSQNRSRADQQGVVTGLQQQGNEEALKMAELIKQNLAQ